MASIIFDVERREEEGLSEVVRYTAVYGGVSTEDWTSEKVLWPTTVVFVQRVLCLTVHHDRSKCRGDKSVVMRICWFIHGSENELPYVFTFLLKRWVLIVGLKFRESAPMFSGWSQYNEQRLRNCVTIYVSSIVSRTYAFKGQPQHMSAKTCLRTLMK